jgi:hypothetical protein
MPELQVRDLVRIDNVSRTGESIAPYAILLGTATFPFETEVARESAPDLVIVRDFHGSPAAIPIGFATHIARPVFMKPGQTVIVVGPDDGHMLQWILDAFDGKHPDEPLWHIDRTRIEKLIEIANGPNAQEKSNDATTPIVDQDVRRMTCCVCGDDAGTFKQHWNRDTGYGICAPCIVFVRDRGASENEIADFYGIAGVNYASVAAPDQTLVAVSVTEC